MRSCQCRRRNQPSGSGGSIASRYRNFSRNRLRALLFSTRHRSFCLNVHGALLPQYRGILPSFWMLANSERCAGVSVYFVNEQIDAGDLCAQRSYEIEPRDTLDSLLRKSKAIAADLLIEVLASIEAGTIARKPLKSGAGSYYSWPDPIAVQRFRESGRRLW
jgi:methionyl-tRNA formyltransferase